ncbi:MAG: ATP-binding protein, partial [Pseudomonadota bacterium]
AMSDGGKLMIQTDGDENFFTLRFSDTGPGIREENLKKIFEPFFTTKQMGKGTGLGLAVSYGIIKMHRGQIVVESNNDPNKGPTGTTFIIKCPLQNTLLQEFI